MKKQVKYTNSLLYRLLLFYQNLFLHRMTLNNAIVINKKTSKI